MGVRRRMVSENLNYYFFPLGSRWLRLRYPPIRGTDVWIMQRWLNRVSLLQPAWQLMRLPEDGVLTGRLLLQLRQLAVHLALWQPREINEFTYLIFGQVAGQERQFGQRPLILGDEGEDVWVLQNRLVAANRRLALILGRPADGVYDTRTARLVRAFQRDSQVSWPDMRVTGQAFLDTLLAIWDRTIIGGRPLRPGDRGLDVLAVQELLRGMGYELTMDGSFDAAMGEAVARWQESHGLAATGVLEAIDFWYLGLERGY